MLTRKQRDFYKAARKAGDAVVPLISSSPAAVNDSVILLRLWHPGSADNFITYNEGDVRQYNGIPYKCAQTHTHHGEPDWDPEHYQAGWFQYHGTSVETARAYIQPLGAHDAYQMNEYAIEGGKVYRCKVNATVWPPSVLPGSWEEV